MSIVHRFVHVQNLFFSFFPDLCRFQIKTLYFCILMYEYNEFIKELNMKKKYVILLCGLLSFCFMSAQNLTDKKGMKQGVWKKTYENGNLMYEGTFKNDKPVGEFRRYYETGALKVVQIYESGDRSKVTIYEADGKTKTAEGSYKGKEKDAEWTYYVEGKVSLIEVYNNGKKNGVSKTYSKEGVLMEEIPYVNDQIDGVHKRYLQDGTKYSESSFKNGVEHGSYKLYEGHDFPVMEGVYKNGKRDGDWIMRDDAGKQTDVLKYKDGVLLNDKELKKKYSKSFDNNEAKKGTYTELDEMR